MGTNTQPGTRIWVKNANGCGPAGVIPMMKGELKERSQRFAGESNAPMFTPPAEITEDVGGAETDCGILVYTDDCSGNNPLVAALAEKGLAYTHLFQNPFTFEMFVASDSYALILVDHACYMDLSFAWDDLVAAYQDGSCVAVASFDWDGSHDASGAVSSLLALGGAGYSHDVTTQGTVHVWNPSPLFTGLPGMLSATQNFYLDEGDGWTYTTAEAGWTPSPQSGEGAAAIGQKLVLLGFLPDQLSPGDGTTLWKNVIDYLTSGGPTPAVPTTWGGIKRLYR